MDNPDLNFLHIGLITVLIKSPNHELQGFLAINLVVSGLSFRPYQLCTEFISLLNNSWSYMKMLIKVEEAAQFLLSIILFAQLQFVWWVYPALLFIPDLSMLGYLANFRVGAFTYNLFHHKAIAIAIGSAGLFIQNNDLMLVGILLYGHSSMDRMLGYGLKQDKGFKFTHLGEIGA
jgi:hypothetical protein